MKEYAIYPFRYMNITQNYNQGNHLPHWQNSKNYSDKPWDEACKDSGRSYFEPQNDFLIEEVLGLNTSTTNSVRLKSVNKLYMPYKAEADYLYLTLTHMNEDNLKQVKQGQILKAGSKILLEGTDGNAKGNHFHVTANLGKYYGMKKNSNGAWCFTYDKSLLPQEAFYVDTNFTTLKNTRGSVFKEKPTDKVGTPVDRNIQENQIEILVDNLRARDKGTTTGSILGYANKGIYTYLNTNTANGYTWYQIEKDIWVASGDNWTKTYQAEIPIDPKDTKIQELEQQIKEKDDTITKLNSQIDNLLAQIKDLEEKIKELENREPVQVDEPIFSYTVTKTDKYVIDLHDGEELKIYAR